MGDVVQLQPRLTNQPPTDPPLTEEDWKRMDEAWEAHEAAEREQDLRELSLPGFQWA